MSARQAEPFWLCHECGAQMRPIKRGNVNHCASCDGEFLEILDDEVNPDPFHELPPPPPVRPRSVDPDHGGNLYAHNRANDQGPPGNFIQQLMGGLFGAAVDPHGQHGHDHEGDGFGRGAAPPADRQGRGQQGGGGGMRTFQFNIGGGNASVSFGSMGGGMGPFGPAGPAGQDDRGLEDFFAGFGAPPGANARAQRHNDPFGPQHPLGQNDPMGPEELLRTLFASIGGEGLGPMGPGGQSSLGDYVMTERGFDHILEQLMQQAGPQGPIPASETVIEGLPRLKLDEESLEKSTFKDCPVCKDDFSAGDEVIRVPCTHIFHPDCIQPWLKVNGSCPVCRFSLVPDEANAPAATRPAQSNQQDQQTQQATPPPQRQSPGPSAMSQSRPGLPARTESGNIVTSVLQRLWGPSGTSNPSSPMTENRPQTSRAPSSSRIDEHTNLPHSGATSGDVGSSANAAQAEQLSNAIPEDYRERHRRREQQQQEQQQQQRDPIHDDLD